MTTEKNNDFLFHRVSADKHLICRDCAYWMSDKSRTNGYCSRTKEKTTLIHKCYLTFEEMYGQKLFYQSQR